METKKKEKWREKKQKEIPFKRRIRKPRRKIAKEENKRKKAKGGKFQQKDLKRRKII